MLIWGGVTPDPFLFLLFAVCIGVWEGLMGGGPTSCLHLRTVKIGHLVRKGLDLGLNGIAWRCWEGHLEGQVLTHYTQFIYIYFFLQD